MNKVIKVYSYIARLYACIATIEGMKAENRQREYEGKSMAYTDEKFFEISEEINEMIDLLEKLEKEHD